MRRASIQPVTFGNVAGFLFLKLACAELAEVRYSLYKIRNYFELNPNESY